MTGVLAFALVAFAVGVVPVAILYALDVRDERRRTERLARWYDEHKG